MKMMKSGTRLLTDAKVDSKQKNPPPAQLKNQDFQEPHIDVVILPRDQAPLWSGILKSLVVTPYDLQLHTRISALRLLEEDEEEVDRLLDEYVEDAADPDILRCPIEGYGAFYFSDSFNLITPEQLLGLEDLERVRLVCLWELNLAAA